MDWTAILGGLAASAGPVGIFLAWMLWRDAKRDERDDARELRRESIEKDRIEADKALAISMTLLAERIK